MNDTILHSIGCPYCGETIDLVVDTSVDDQEYIEDCSVCCRPIRLTVSVTGDDVLVVARDENET